MSSGANPASPEPPRRDFFRKTLAIVAGLLAGIIPGAAGLAVLLDPLRRKSAVSTFLKVTTLDAIPSDGTPRKFQIISDREDAWSKFPNTPIGAVYLQRQNDQVTAFNVRCPHAGCFVDAIAGDGFHCPCHNSRFNADGSLVPGSVSPRGLDELEIDPIALKNGVVQVKFQNFVAGTPERRPRT